MNIDFNITKYPYMCERLASKTIQERARKGTLDADGFIVRKGVLEGYIGDSLSLRVPEGVTWIPPKALTPANRDINYQIESLPNSIRKISDDHPFWQSDLTGILPEKYFQTPEVLPADSNMGIFYKFSESPYLKVADVAAVYLIQHPKLSRIAQRCFSCFDLGDISFNLLGFLAREEFWSLQAFARFAVFYTVFRHDVPTTVYESARQLWEKSLESNMEEGRVSFEDKLPDLVLNQGHMDPTSPVFSRVLLKDGSGYAPASLVKSSVAEVLAIGLWNRCQSRSVFTSVLLDADDHAESLDRSSLNECLRAATTVWGDRLGKDDAELAQLFPYLRYGGKEAARYSIKMMDRFLPKDGYLTGWPSNEVTSAIGAALTMSDTGEGLTCLLMRDVDGHSSNGPVYPYVRTEPLMSQYMVRCEISKKDVALNDCVESAKGSADRDLVVALVLGFLTNRLWAAQRTKPLSYWELSQLFLDSRFAPSLTPIIWKCEGTLFVVEGTQTITLDGNLLRLHKDSLIGVESATPIVMPDKWRNFLRMKQEQAGKWMFEAPAYDRCSVSQDRFSGCKVAVKDLLDLMRCVFPSINHLEGEDPYGRASSYIAKITEHLSIRFIRISDYSTGEERCELKSLLLPNRDAFTRSEANALFVLDNMTLRERCKRGDETVALLLPNLNAAGIEEYTRPLLNSGSAAVIGEILGRRHTLGLGNYDTGGSLTLD